MLRHGPRRRDELIGNDPVHVQFAEGLRRQAEGELGAPAKGLPHHDRPAHSHGSSTHPEQFAGEGKIVLLGRQLVEGQVQLFRQRGGLFAGHDGYAMPATHQLVSQGADGEKMPGILGTDDRIMCHTCRLFVPQGVDGT